MNFIVTPTHQLFLGDLDHSSIAVFAVAIDQHLRGHTIEIPRLRKAPTAFEAWLYSDGGDLFVTTYSGVRHRIDVKRSGKNFVNTWPHERVFVASEKSVNEAGDTVHAYITVSQDLKHMVIMGCETRPHWRIFEYGPQEKRQRVYACPPEHVIFRPLRWFA